jgi:hypothetical protein
VARLLHQLALVAQVPGGQVAGALGAVVERPVLIRPSSVGLPRTTPSTPAELIMTFVPVEDGC